jgi:iron(III) transport system substrate-binding protein
MQVQSGNDPPKKLELGERAVMADGNEYTALQLKEAGKPLEIVYAPEGTPFIIGPSSVWASAPNPNAARLMLNYMATAEAQQLIVDVGGLRSVHPQIKEPPGRRLLKDIKLMKDDPAAVEAQSEEIKARYAKLFGV